MTIYECPKHGTKNFSKNKDCEDCIRIVCRIKENKEVHARLGPKRKCTGRTSVYWPTNNSHEGRTIENLSHTPQHFVTKTAYRDYLKRHGIQEAG